MIIICNYESAETPFNIGKCLHCLFIMIKWNIITTNDHQKCTDMGLNETHEIKLK